MDFLAETRFLADLAADQMTNRIRVHRSTGQKVTDRTTGRVTDAMAVVYGAGRDGAPGKITSGTQVAAGRVAAAGHDGLLSTLRVDVPVGTHLHVGDVVEVLSSRLDPDLVGMRLELVRRDDGERRTAHRWSAELVTR